MRRKCDCGQNLNEMYYDCSHGHGMVEVDVFYCVDCMVVIE